MGRSKNNRIGWSGDGVDYAKRGGRNRRDKGEIETEGIFVLKVLFAMIVGLIVCALWAALTL